MGSVIRSQGSIILPLLSFVHIHPVGVEILDARFVHIEYGGRKAAHYVRHQTPQGSVLSPQKPDSNRKSVFGVTVPP